MSVRQVRQQIIIDIQKVLNQSDRVVITKLKRWIRSQMKSNIWKWERDKTCYQSTLQSVLDFITSLTAKGKV